MALKGVTILKDSKGFPSKATFDLKKHEAIQDYLDHLLMEEAKKDEFIPYEEVQKELYLKHNITKKKK